MIESDIIERNNELISKFIKQYKVDCKPINVKVRELIPELKTKERFTHSIHKYPAKLLIHIPYLFINNTILSQPGDNLLDPFNGTGTVSLEGMIAGRNVFAADSNPLARLISKVKVTKHDIAKVKKCIEDVVSNAASLNDTLSPEVRNCEFWFPRQNRNDLSKLFFHINKIVDNDVRDFMLVALSNCVKKVSYADPRISVPVKLNPDRYSDLALKQKVIDRLNTVEKINVISKFKDIAIENLKRSEKLNCEFPQGLKSFFICSDARNLRLSDDISMSSNSIQLIVTSPPYAGAQKYIRSSSLNLGWTGLAKVDEIRELDKKNIGREIYSTKDRNIVKTGITEADFIIDQISKKSNERANVVCQYLIEMMDAIDEMYRVLKNGGFLVMIIGNNKVCGFEFNTQQYLTTYMLQKGLKSQFTLIDDIASYGLMTKRNKTADIISREYILVLKK